MTDHHRQSNSPLLFLALAIFLLLPAVPSVRGNLMCWSDDCADGSDWCIQLCRPDQRSCLAQYRRNTAGRDVASYFGCHGVGCDPDCIPTVGTASDYSCCCSGDLCNSIPGLTPNGDNLTSPPNPQPTPEVDSTDDEVVCEVYDCGDNPDNCFHGYQECPTNETAFCLAHYSYDDEDRLYRLSKKECTTDSSNWCSSPLCEIDTSGDHAEVFCCCTGDLCNQNVILTDPENVDTMIVDPCEEMDCHHSCIVHDGTAHCYCDYGNILSDDKRTCVDLNECKFNNGSCEVDCVNEIGTGYHCSCPDNQKLAEDGRTCEATGLICHFLQCNTSGIGCDAGFTNEYCDKTSGDVMGQQSCQATYKLRDDGIFEPRFLSCFAGDFECTDDQKCVLELISPDISIYHCCCRENYCNAEETLLFPSNGSTIPHDTGPTNSVATPPSVITPDDISTEPSETSTAQPSKDSEDKSNNRTIFVVVVVVCLVLLIPVIAAGVGCISYMYCIGNRKDTETIDLQTLEREMESPGLMFCNLSFIDKVGQGRFAAVWRAKNVEDEVAVKVFPNSQMSRDSWLRECEIYRTPELEHKYILSFKGSVERGAELWIVTDYYPLGSLHDLLKKRTLSLKQFCDLAESAAVGLAHLHDQRIIDGVTKKPSIAHRDLKSKNILIRNDHTCVISDFGLAIKFLNEETSSDAHGQVGTSRYMAPEVLEGAISFQREAYLRIDVYAFALILWELASQTNITSGSMKQYRPPFDEYVSCNPSIEEMREVVVTQFKRPTIPKGFTTSGDFDCLRDTIEESWDQEPEARLSAQCIAERIRTFKLSKFSSKDSGLTETNSPAEVTYNSDSIESNLAPTTPSLTSSRTMSPMTSKTCMLDSGTESIGAGPGQGFSNETIRLGTSNSSFLLFRNPRDSSSSNFDPLQHNFGGSTVRCNRYNPSNRTLYGNSHSQHSTETTV